MPNDFQPVLTRAKFVRLGYLNQPMVVPLWELTRGSTVLIATPDIRFEVEVSSYDADSDPDPDCIVEGYYFLFAYVKETVIMGSETLTPNTKYKFELSIVGETMMIHTVQKART